MPLRSKLTSTSLAAILWASVATAQNAQPSLPSPEQIRQHYNESVANWQKTPEIAALAFVGAEDRYYFERSAQISTIAQQIGRWYLLPQAGKLQRIALAYVIGESLSHEEVLNWYVNQIYLGQSCYGISGAAMAYFGKSVDDLRLEEVAYLAALPISPMSFHPIRSYDRAVERRNFVLSEMRKAGFITAKDAQSAIHTNLVVREPLGRCEQSG